MPLWEPISNENEAAVADAHNGRSSLPALHEATPFEVPCDVNDECLHELFEQQAANTPEAPAVTHARQEITYRELNGRVNQLAHFLRRKGVGPEQLVGILLERSVDMAVCVLGVLKAGGAYLPLDPKHPADRIAFILDDAKVKLLLTQQHFAETLRLPPGLEIVCVDTLSDRIDSLSTQNPRGLTTCDNLAYLVYTSGSTGAPKGVEIAHRGLVNVLQALAREFSFQASDKLLAVTTLSFDIAALELCLPLIVGAEVVIASREVASDGIRLLQLMKEKQITIMQATPATWRLLLSARWNEATNLKILCGGEEMPRQLADVLLKRSDAVWNLYGPSETTIWSTVQRVETGNGPVPIGQPVANTQLYIVDESLQQLGSPFTGELLIGGIGLARAYRDRPDLTAEKFIPNPFSETAGARLYRTGDLVRHSAKDTIEFLGRLDNQVKVRGVRIELGEIEHALRNCSGVTEAVVVVRENDPDNQQLVAYVVADSDSRPTPDELRTKLQASLPESMAPSAFVFLNALPRTPNGKIDRLALKTHQFSETPGEYVEAGTPTEKLLAGFWIDVLRVRRVGIHDNFFALGGHSLPATLIATRIESAKLVSIPIRDIFSHPTVATLAAYIDDNVERLSVERGQVETIPRIDRHVRVR